MIDYIIAFFFFLDNMGYLSLSQIFTINLLLVLIGRGFYILAYYFNYGTDSSLTLFTKDEKIVFSLKQIAMILFGMLSLPIAGFISFYSLLMTGGYIKQMGETKRSKPVNILGTIIQIFFPLIGILWFGLIGDILTTIAITISIMVFWHYGVRISSLSLTDLLQKYDNRRLTKLNSGRKIQLGVLVILVAFPSTMIIGTAVYAPPSKITTNVITRDGVNLATDVYFAPGSFGTPRPVILIRTTYGKDGLGMYKSLYSTQNYHIVAQDCRGTYDSGDKEKAIIFQMAYLDGVDTINWILEQPWCSGKIASVGASALALNQFYYAGMNPDGLVTQSLMVGTPDVYDISMYRGGAFMENMVINWLKGTASNYEYALNQIISHPKKDSYHNSTCLSMDIGPSFKHVNVPAIHIGGWYDTFTQGTLNGYMGYDDLGLENARGKQLLIMGPFTHGFPREGKVGEAFFPSKSISAFDLYLDWEQKLFDHVLLGTSFDWTGNRVAYYMMSSPDNEEVMDYRYAKDWPIPHVNDTWYLNPDGLLLENFKGLTNNEFSYQYDPRNPVPTIGGNNLMLASGPYDQRSIETRDDVILFESSPFNEPYEIVGHIWAHLSVKSNCPNTDFTVKITDVYPNGTSMLITDGIINAIRRNGFDKDAPPLNIAGVVEVVIDLWSTAYTFAPEHKIRVAISSSNYPRFAANPNTGAPQTVYSYQYLEKNIATNSILVGPSYNSYIVLPTPI